MAQDFSLRYMLVDGQGNFGSVDGDNAAAMRYTEIRMSKISHEMLADIDKETVDFGPNYDGSEHEPLIMPTRIPNLLINGSSGIAVGMATNFPPHNLTEVINGLLALLENTDISIDELMEFIPGPDFPTSGIIHGISGVRDGYRTGRGRVVMRGKTHTENLEKGNREAIIIDELPYQVNKKSFIEKIAELVGDKKIEGISDLRDESDKSGMRVVIELKKGEIPDVVLNNLYKQTQLQDNFGMNMVALIDGQPKLLNLKQILDAFIKHRREVITRRTVYELKKARERGHVLEGLAVALANVDAMIKIIKAASTPPDAKKELMEKSWKSEVVEAMLKKSADGLSRPNGLSLDFGLKSNGYKLSDVQAQEILQLRLQRLTGLEQEKIVNEYHEIMDTIIDLLNILSNSERVTTIISDELKEIKSQYGDERKSEIVTDAYDLSIEDLIAPQDMVVTLSNSGYIKAQVLDDYRAQKRGGRGKQAMTTKEDDFIEQMFVANSHDNILCFSSRGQVYWLKVYEVPQGSRISRGKPIVNLFPLMPGEKINAILAVKDFVDDQYIFMATAKGTVKKTPLSDFSNPRKSGIIAIKLANGDYLVGAGVTNGEQDIILVSNGGKAVWFDEHDVRSMGRNAAGVRGMKLPTDQQVLSLLIASSEEESVLVATENGFGKRTILSEFRKSGRGTQGVKAIQVSDRNGIVVAAKLVGDHDEIMLITTGGVLIRTRVSEIRELGRATQGVTLINLSEEEKLSGIEKIVESDHLDDDQDDLPI
jgi:DNA gyrase subunit A